jgi:hypothetical protein
VADEEEFYTQLEEQLSKVRVSDILTQTVYTLSSLGFRRLAPGDERDLEQARLAIDALRALVPVLERAITPELARDFNQVVANLQLAYAAAAHEPQRPAAPEPEAGEPG